MSQVQQLITEHIDIWIAADTGKKSGRGRASRSAGSVYGIKKLRELILELAVRGKLVSQDANDEPASELLKRILTEKVKLVAEGKIKKDKALAAITAEEKPSQFPNGWVCTRLADIVNILNGRAYKKEELLGSGTPVLRVGNLFTSDHWYYSDLKLEEEKYCNRGDLLFAWSASFGPFLWDGERSIFHYHIWKLDFYGGDLIYKRYLYTFLLEQTQKIKSAGHGVMMIHMTKEKMEKLVVYLPPLAEQHRIVAKVDELMALCDQLEAQHSNAGDAHEQLVSHLLGTLTQSQDAADFSTNWQRIATHFDTLFTTEATIDSLKQTLLQLAVMGKLVPQDPKDEPASELLKRINETKSSLEMKIPAKTKTTSIDHNKIPFQLPCSWRWEKLGNLVSDLRYGTSAKCEYEINGVPVLRIPNIGDEGISLEDLKFGKLTKEEQLNLNLKAGDALLIRSNGSASLVGKTALVSAESIHCAFAGYLVRLRIKVELLLPDYFQLSMKSSYIRGCIEGPIRTTSGVKNINTTEISNLHISLPSIPEQYRIITKVDELMARCEQLKSRITDARQSQQKLADVLVAQALAVNQL